MSPGKKCLQAEEERFRMKIEIRLYASFRRLLPGDCAANECFADVEEGTTVEDLLARLGVPPDAPRVVFLNGVHAGGMSC